MSRILKHYLDRGNELAGKDDVMAYYCKSALFCRPRGTLLTLLLCQVAYVA